MQLVYSSRCLGYSYKMHIEKPERVADAFEILASRGYSYVEPTPASEEDVLRVHTRRWLEEVKNGDFCDQDTPGSEDIFSYARLSAGGAILAAKIGGFSLLRPPGHHAGRDGRALGAKTLGFCYFNNVAIAVKCLGRPTLILDIDGHHGNGTQEIFLGDPQVTYVSLHGGIDFPWTGMESERNCLNFPLAAKTGNETYLRVLDSALSLVDADKVETIAISAGFDAHEGDIASLGLSSECYRKIGERIRREGKKVFCVLEGGYSSKIIAECVHNLIQGLEGK
jgi:acetoin utilization deacetylase AcuC-like enzyme